MVPRILMIDDSLPLHKLLSHFVTAAGYEFISAYDGESGIAAALEQNPSLILLDVQMPNIDGLETCRRLKSDHRTKAIPVIFLTAEKTPGEKVKALDLGAVDYVTKPFHPEELVARGRAALRTSAVIQVEGRTEPVTGLWNRACLDRHLELQYSLVARTGQSISCILVDIDALRVINANQGDASGDRVIRSVATILKTHCNSEHAIFSLGKGRFAIIVTASDRHESSRMAYALCDVLGKTVINLDGIDVPVSCSFGVADTQVSDANAVLERTEGALARAKLNGGGVVSVARLARDRTTVAA